MIPPGYTVTRDGRVKGPSGRWLKLTNKRGHVSVWAQIDGASRRFGVGRLVCEVYNGPPPTPEHRAEHIDGDSTNNHADNLRWTTRALQGEGNHNAVLTREKVHKIREAYRSGGWSMDSLAREYGVSQPTIFMIVHNRTWKDPDYTPPPPRR